MPLFVLTFSPTLDRCEGRPYLPRPHTRSHSGYHYRLARRIILGVMSMNLSRACATVLVIAAGSLTVSAQNGVHTIGSYFLRGKLIAISGGQITVAPHAGGTPV